MKGLLLLIGLMTVSVEASAQTVSFTAGGGALNLSITTATTGSDPTDATDNSTELSWDSQGSATSKITVSTTCPGQSFGLYVELTVTSWGSGTSGTEQGEIQLTDGMLDTDLFRDIPTTSPGGQGSGTLTYRASATTSQGASVDEGDDVHTILLTIAAQ
ncbi:MAG: hypothetical protein JJ896_05405 [Rhodothermales bacterium]|nr:hypothetical protein [Rhodothermales bacterium]MBO6779071.1 hypothetical protein [Rhodothermales bacterium]